MINAGGLVNPYSRTGTGLLEQLPIIWLVHVIWLREIWVDSAEIAQLPSGVWMLREAAKVLGLVDEVLK